MSDCKEISLEDAVAFVTKAFNDGQGLILVATDPDADGVGIAAHVRNAAGGHILLAASDLWNMVANDDGGNHVLQLTGQAMASVARNVNGVEKAVDLLAPVTALN